LIENLQLTWQLSNLFLCTLDFFVDDQSLNPTVFMAPHRLCRGRPSGAWPAVGR